MKKIIFVSLAISFSSLIHAAYEDHFESYFEYCTGTQWKLQNGDIGGSPGHGFTYIHGLCKDYRSEYPRVIPCSQVSAKLRKKYPHEGVGISLDKNFTNVMWVAVPGREMIINGNLKRKAITSKDIEKHLKRIEELKVFYQVKSKSDALTSYRPNTSEYRNAVALDTLGTDHAVNWARELHCVKIPAPKEKLANVAEFLNASNEKHRNGPDYVWSKLSNNCVHLSINSSNAMSINDKIKIDQKFLAKYANIALPANAFLMYADLSVLDDLPGNRRLAKELSERSFYPAQVGSIMEVLKAFPSGDHFNTDELGVLTAPRIKKPFKLLSTPRKYEKKYMTPENSELKANAAMWVKRYKKALSELKQKEKASQVEDYLLKQLKLAEKILKSEA